jgi:hypothetical protein
VEGNDCCLFFKTLSLNFPGVSEKNYDKPQSGCLVTQEKILTGDLLKIKYQEY